MIFEAVEMAVLVASASVAGVVFFGHDKRLIGAERYIVPVAVGVFLSLVLNELIPEVLAEAPKLGTVVIMLGFLGFYILAHKLHQRYHHLEADDCNRKGAAALILVGDSIHNFADGIVLGGAFLIDPTVGVATAVGLALHEIPQEIVEFGVLVRAGYTRFRAAFLNFLSASTIVIGTVFVMLLSGQAGEYVWILTGFAAGNLLFLAASDLLPRIHGNLSHYGNIWYSATAIALGFLLMTLILIWAHEQHGDEHHFDTELENLVLEEVTL